MAAQDVRTRQAQRRNEQLFGIRSRLLRQNSGGGSERGGARREARQRGKGTARTRSGALGDAREDRRGRIDDRNPVGPDRRMVGGGGPIRASGVSARFEKGQRRRGGASGAGGARRRAQKRRGNPSRVRQGNRGERRARRADCRPFQRARNRSDRTAGEERANEPLRGRTCGLRVAPRRARTVGGAEAPPVQDGLAEPDAADRGSRDAQNERNDPRHGQDRVVR